MSRHVFVSRDVVFDEGRPRRTASVGEQTQIPLFDVNPALTPLTDNKLIPATKVSDPIKVPDPIVPDPPDQPDVDQSVDQTNQHIVSIEPRHSN